MATYFISDLHLDDSQPEITTLWRLFLKKIADDCDALYILGDFFELWLGDDLASAYQQQIMVDLANFAATHRVYFMVGNRDFLIQQDFYNRTQAIPLTDPTLINLYGKKILLAHGDDLCLSDRTHQLYRALVRKSWVIRLFYGLPKRWRLKIANMVRENSKRRGAERPLVLQDASEAAVAAILANWRVDEFIHGHTHRPSLQYYIKPNKTQRRIVLSDWLVSQGNYLVYYPDGYYRLEYFKQVASVSLCVTEETQ